MQRLSGSPVAMYALDLNPSILAADGAFIFFGPYMQYMSGVTDTQVKWILENRSEEDQLIAAEDFQLVQSHLEKLGAGADSLRYFSRTDEEYHPTYELIRLGRMPEAESILGRMLNRMMGPEDKDVLRKQSIDGSQLPEFEAVRRYLGPGGGYSRTEQDGWYVSGVLLNKQALYLDGSPSSAVTASPGRSRSPVTCPACTGRPRPWAHLTDDLP